MKTYFPYRSAYYSNGWYLGLTSLCKTHISHTKSFNILVHIYNILEIEFADLWENFEFLRLKMLVPDMKLLNNLSEKANNFSKTAMSTHVCFNWTQYICSYVKWVWYMSQYSKLSDFRYWLSQFWTFWLVGIHTMYYLHHEKHFLVKPDILIL